MAKKDKDKEEKVKSLDDQITSTFGDNILVGGNHIIATKKQIIPVSPELDLILGDGIPVGSFVILTGKQKLGKTTLALTIAANAQRAEYNDELTPNGRMVYFINIEHRIKGRDLEGIHGLDCSPERFKVVQSAAGKILTAEEYLDICEKILNQSPGCILIIDSFSQLCTEAGYSSDIKDKTRDDTTNLLGKFSRRNHDVIGVNKCIVIGVTHIIANTGGTAFSSPWTEASGTKIQYAADVKLKGEYFKAWLDKETQIGQDVHWLCQTSAIGPPGGKCISKLRYGYGIDKEMELLNVAVNLGLIKKGGTWYVFPNDEKFQGLENARDVLVSNPKLYTELYTNIRNMLGMST